MLTLVEIQASKVPPAETASLIADYIAFDRQRTWRRQYLKAFGGMAVLVLLGAVFGRVPARESAVVAGLLVLPPSTLAAIEVISWRRLIRRLNNLRAETRAVKKS
jgi:hypothetical protein